MNCEQVMTYLDAYADGEFLDAVHIREIEAHLVSCAECTRQLERLRTTSKSVQGQSTYFQAPEHLIRNIEGIGSLSPGKKPVHRRQMIWTLANLCWTVVAALTMVFFFTYRAPTRSLESELVSGHIRSLQASHLYDVASSDRHTVKPWFQGKLDFSPEVPNMAAEGFPLLGGRLDYIAGHAAAALVYSRGKHTINVFVLPTAPKPLGETFRDGYRLTDWTEHGLTYYAVSDTDSLSEFKDKFQQATK